MVKFIVAIFSIATFTLTQCVDRFLFESNISQNKRSKKITAGTKPQKIKPTKPEYTDQSAYTEYTDQADYTYQEIQLRTPYRRRQIYQSTKISRPGSYSECLNLGCDECSDIIKKKSPGVQTGIVPEGNMVTSDYAIGRVRIFCNKRGIVVGVPKIG